MNELIKERKSVFLTCSNRFLHPCVDNSWCNRNMSTGYSTFACSSATTREKWSRPAFVVQYVPHPSYAFRPAPDEMLTIRFVPSKFFNFEINAFEKIIGAVKLTAIACVDSFCFYCPYQPNRIDHPRIINKRKRSGSLTIFINQIGNKNFQFVRFRKIRSQKILQRLQVTSLQFQSLYSLYL